MGPETERIFLGDFPILIALPCLSRCSTCDLVVNSEKVPLSPSLVNPPDEAREVAGVASAENALRLSLSEEWLRRAISIETVGVLFFRLDGRILQANAALQRMSGYTVEELRSMTEWGQLTPPEFQDATRRAAVELAERGSTAPYEKQWCRKDGSRFWGLFSPTRLSGAGVESECVEFIIDITEQKRAAARVRESEARQSFLLTLGDTLRMLVDPVEIEAAATRVLGEHLGANRVAYFEVRGADYFIDRDYSNGVSGLAGRHPIIAFGERLLGAYLNGQTVCSRDVAADAELSPAEREAYASIQIGAHIGVPLIKGGKLVAGLAVHSSAPRDWQTHEITLVEESAQRTWETVERARAEAALRASEERFRAAVCAVSSLIWTNNARGEMEGEQPGWSGFTGQSPEEYLGYGWARAVHPEDAQPTIDAWIQAVAAKRMFEFEHRLRRKDGEWRVCSVRAVPVLDEQGGIREWVGVHNDITEQKRAAQALREGAQRLHFMAESMPQKIFTARPDGDVDYFNWKWMEFTGLTFEQIGDWGWLQFIHPDDVAENIRRWTHSVTTGEYFELEHRFRRHDGVYRWHLSRAHAMRDAKGAVTMWIGSSTDIDDQKRAEEKLEKTVAERTAKLRESIAELEAFSYSIAHDMRAPLRSLQGFSEVLLGEHAEKLDSEAQSYLQRISKSAGRMDKLITDVLSYSRVVQGEWPMEPVDVAELLRGIADTYPMLASEEVDIVMEGEFPLVLGSEAMLMQVFSNLLGNAVKFMRPGTKPQIRIWAEPSGERVKLFVRDNGIGIAPEDHRKIFGIFHQVGKKYGGTGIGLAIVKKAVERMNGKVGLESELGQGTTFWIEVQRA